MLPGVSQIMILWHHWYYCSSELWLTLKGSLSFRALFSSFIPLLCVQLGNPKPRSHHWLERKIFRFTDFFRIQSKSRSPIAKKRKVVAEFSSRKDPTSPCKRPFSVSIPQFPKIFIIKIQNYDYRKSKVLYFCDSSESIFEPSLRGLPGSRLSRGAPVLAWSRGAREEESSIKQIIIDFFR